ncbi:DUF6286 domain-containing protein [Brevibacterium sp.]|uniref:DUF6286 domain-containing protein n=1 Tax=Brevibacterium sp. TaxID=1701 RepID=UPI0025C1E71D|nr:DUF6286 domain-containing protein [Brevibacterium sp.]
MSTHPQALTRRPARRVPAIILAFMAITVGGLLVWTIGARLLDGTWSGVGASAAHRIGGLRLDGMPVRIIVGILAIIGLAFLISALVPGAARHLAILAGETPGQTAMSRRDIARRVERQVEQVDGVSAVRARLSGHVLSVQVRTPVDESESILRQVRTAVQETIAELTPVIHIRSRVHLSRTR